MTIGAGFIDFTQSGSDDCAGFIDFAQSGSDDRCEFTRLSPSHQFSGVEVGVDAGLEVAARLSPVIRLVALEADVVGVPVHGVTSRVRVESSP